MEYIKSTNACLSLAIIQQVEVFGICKSSCGRKAPRYHLVLQSNGVIRWKTCSRIHVESDLRQDKHQLSQDLQSICVCNLSL